MNALRSHLYEFGHVAPVGISDLPRLAKVVDDPDTDIPELAREICRMLLELVAKLTGPINALKARIAAMSNEADMPRQLQTMPDVGPTHIQPHRLGGIQAPPDGIAPRRPSPKARGCIRPPSPA